VSAFDPDAVAEGLWRRLRDVVLAERRLERFAFSEESAAPDRLSALAVDASALADLARDVTLRALAVATDGGNHRVLAALGDDPRSLGQLSQALGLPALAVSERVAALAQVGLAARNVERDDVSGTAAGRGLVALVEAISAGLAARCRAGLGSLL
jgi:DNA-binding HxlR family transcriptional regulator